MEHLPKAEIDARNVCHFKTRMGEYLEEETKGYNH